MFEGIELAGLKVLALKTWVQKGETFAVLDLKIHPRWDDAKPVNEQIRFKEHSDNLRRLRAEKKISIGSRYSDKGMVILEAANEVGTRSLFASDVMVEKKTFILQVNQFRPFHKGAIE